MQRSGGGRSPKRSRQQAKASATLGWTEKLLCLFAAATVAMVVWGRFTAPPRARSASVARASIPVVREAPAVSAAPAIPEPLPIIRPREWTVLFSSPSDEQREISRRSPIQLYFNLPVDAEMAETVEWAFTLFPSTPGTFSWPRPDRLIFTPQAPLRAGTEYTVALTPVTGRHEGEPFEVRSARWSFVTGGARTYRKDIQPLIGTYCVQCHAPERSAATVPLTTYQDIRRYVVSGRSAESLLYTFPQQRHHHINMAGPDHSTKSKLAVIKDWIDEDRAAE